MLEGIEKCISIVNELLVTADNKPRKKLLLLLRLLKGVKHEMGPRKKVSH